MSPARKREEKSRSKTVPRRKLTISTTPQNQPNAHRLQEARQASGSLFPPLPPTTLPSEKTTLSVLAIARMSGTTAANPRTARQINSNNSRRKPWSRTLDQTRRRRVRRPRGINDSGGLYGLLFKLIYEISRTEVTYTFFLLFSVCIVESEPKM
jgi:hypothetical protein